MEKKTAIKIEGMTCSHCSSFVSKTIKAVEGVKDVSVDLEKGNAEVTFEDALTNEMQIADAVNKTGIYKAFIK
jgi:copper chaperone